MKKIPHLIVMLTYNDLTVRNAAELFESAADTRAICWGMKEEALPLPEMRALYARMREKGKRTALEVVAYEEDECLAGAEMAAECGVEILMGTIFSESVNRLCQRTGMKYMPFVGEVSERPSILHGTLDGMVAEAETYLAKGAYGIDLLGYRFTGDATALNRAFVQRVNAPVCIAGSVNSFQRLDEVKEAAPWAFTVGSAFFDRCFGAGFAEQINTVCGYLAGEPQPADPAARLAASVL